MDLEEILNSTPPSRAVTALVGGLRAYRVLAPTVQPKGEVSWLLLAYRVEDKAYLAASSQSDHGRH